MIDFKKIKVGDKTKWQLRAYGVRPYIARLDGFDKEYRYARRFLNRNGNLYAEALLDSYDGPLLLDVRHQIASYEARAWLILHGTDIESLQLTHVTQSVIDALLEAPELLEIAPSIGNLGRILNPTILNPRFAIVIASPAVFEPREALVWKDVVWKDVPFSVQLNPTLPSEKRARIKKQKKTPPVLDLGGVRKFRFDD